MLRGLVGVIGLALATSPAQAQQLFDFTDHPLGSASPRRVIAADVEPDGDLDLIAACTTGGAGETHVLTNAGNGSFSPTQMLPTAGQASCVAAADFDLDLDPDLAVGTGFPVHSIEIFENRGGSFVSVNTLKASSNVNGIVALDLDGDAVPDLAACEEGDGRNCTGQLVRVRTNVGGFQFTETGTYATLCLPLDMTAGDFDGTNGVDLATADSFAGGEVTVFLNDGSGGFSSGTGFPVPGHPLSLDAADFDGDGFDDLATSGDRAGITTPLTVLWSTGSGGFTTQKYGSLREAGPIRSADFDGDGDLDVLAAASLVTSANCWFTIMRNEGNRTFSLGISRICPASPYGAVVADLDPSNPLPDVAIAEFGVNAIGVFLQTATTWPILELSTSSSCFFPGDPITITAANGGPGAPLVASILTLNGVPTWVPLALATFDGAGTWPLNATVPPGLSGLQFEFAVFGLLASGRLETSNWSEIQFF